MLHADCLSYCTLYISYRVGMGLTVSTTQNGDFFSFLRSLQWRCRNLNLLLTKREGRTGEYWLEAVAVRTERSEVRTKTTESRQNSPVRLELVARFVSSLYGPGPMLVCFLLERTSVHMHSKGLKGFHRNIDLMTRVTQKKQATTSLKKKTFST